MKVCVFLSVFAYAVHAQVIVEKFNILSGHTAQIADLTFSPDGKYLASVGYYREAKIWSTERKALHKDLPHEEQFYVSSADFSPDSRFLVTATKGRKLITEKEGVLFVWNVQTGQQVRRIDVGSGEIHDVACSADGKYIACANKEKTVSLYDGSSGQLLKTLAGHERSVEALEFSTNGKWLISMEEFGRVAVWDVAKGEAVFFADTKARSVRSVDFTHDSKIAFCMDIDGKFTYWTVPDGALMESKLAVQRKNFRPKAVSANLGYLLTLRQNLIAVFNNQVPDTLFQVRDYPRQFESQFTFSSDGDLLVAADRNGAIVLWKLGPAASQSETLRPMSAEAQFMPLGGITAGKVTKVESVEIETNVWKRMTGHVGQVRGLDFLAGGHTLVSSGFDKTVRVWDADKGQAVRTLTGHTAPLQHLTTSADGKWILSGGGDETVRVWDAASGQLVRTLQSDRGYSVFSIAISSNRKLVAAGSQYKRILVWDVTTGQKLKTFDGSDRPIYSVAFSADAKHLFVVTGMEIKQWDVQSGAEVTLRGNSYASGHQHYINCLSASADGRWLASGGNDKRVVLWDAGSLQEERDLKGHSGEITCLDFSNDGTLLASGSLDKTVKLWSTADGKLVRTFSGNPQYVRSVSISPDQRFVAAADEGGEIVVWEIPAGAVSGKAIADRTPPTITVSEPTVKRGMRQTVPAKDLVVKGIAKDESGILEVLVNGIEARVTAQGEFAATIKLAVGENVITIRATDTKNNSAEETFTVQRETEMKSSTAVKSLDRRDYALLIGTDDYDSWSDLVNPINDSRALEKELTEHYGFQVERVENPMMSGIMAKLREYAQKSFGDKDQLFIFVAGHGQFDDVFKEGYLVAKDSKRDDELRTSYVSHSNLRTIINNIPCKHVFLVMDVCFGGTFDPLVASRGDEYSQISKDEFIERKLKQKTRKYMTSGGKEYVPDGVPGRHSPFTRRLLEALRSYGGADGIVTISELQSFVDKVSPQPQSGKFGSDEAGSDFLFIVR